MGKLMDPKLTLWVAATGMRKSLGDCAGQRETMTAVKMLNRIADDGAAMCRLYEGFEDVTKDSLVRSIATNRLKDTFTGDELEHVLKLVDEDNKAGLSVWNMLQALVVDEDTLRAYLMHKLGQIEMASISQTVRKALEREGQKRNEAEGGFAAFDPQDDE